jgi:phosphoglycerol transferase MdoB-like AlkP superfamily enzyme
MPLFPLLAVAFIVLKLCDVIAWSWWWVLAPIWGPFALVAVILLCIAITALVLVCCGKNPKQTIKVKCNFRRPSRRTL